MNTDTVGSMPSPRRPLRVLFVNRMAGMVRGGGETFDLEISRHLAELGCEASFLTGRPVVKRAVLGPEEWWGGETVEGLRFKVEGEEENVQRSTSNIQRSSGGPTGSFSGQKSIANNCEPASSIQHTVSSNQQPITTNQAPSTFSLEPLTSNRHSQIANQKSQIGSQSKIQNPQSKICTTFLRSPWLGWFPWDKVRGGWRIRLVDLWLFEYRAARWVIRHQDEFDVIQICELPELVKMLKRWGCRAKVSMRLPGPQLYPGYGKGALEMADLLIASGTSIEFYKDRLDRELVDIPNGVDVGMFRPANTVEGSRLKVQGEEGVRCSVFSGRGRERGVDGCGSEAANKYRWATIKSDVEKSCISNPEHRTPNPEHRVLRVIYVARLTKIKNHGLLLRAVAGVKAKGVEVKVTLVGSGPLRGDIEDMVRELGLEEQVELLGEVPYEQLPGLYQAADVAVVASDYESFGFVVLEAMACGLPVVSTRVGMVPGLLGEGLQVASCKLQEEEGPETRDVRLETGEEGVLGSVFGVRGRGGENVSAEGGSASGGQRSTLNFQLSSGGSPDSKGGDELERCGFSVEQPSTLNLEPSTALVLPGGLVVPVGDVGAMEEGLRWMMENRACWVSMGEFNREMVVQCYSWDASAEKLLGEYRRAGRKTEDERQ